MGLSMGGEQGLKRGWALSRQEEKVGLGAPRKRELRFRSLEEHGTSGSMRKGSTRKWRAGSVRFLCLAQVYGPSSADVASEAEF